MPVKLFSGRIPRVISLRTVLQRLLISSVMVPTLLMIFLLIISLSILNTQTLLREQSQLTNTIASRVSDFLIASEDTLQSLGDTALEVPAAELQTYLDAIMKSQPAFTSLVILSTNGNLVAVSPISNYSFGLSMVNQPYFPSSQNIGTLLYSEPVSLTSTLPEDITLSYRSQDGRYFVGNISLSKVQQIIELESQSIFHRTLFLSTNEHQIIASPNNSITDSENISLNSRLPKYSIPFSKSFLVIDGLDTLIETYAIIPQTGWILTTQSVFWYLIQYYVFSILVFLFVFIFGWVLIGFQINRKAINQIILPLSRLTQLADELADGDSSQMTILESSPSAFFELDTLQKSFRRMWEGIHLRQQSLIDSELKYRALIDQSNDALYMEINGLVETANPKFFEMFDLEKPASLKECPNITSLVPPAIKAQVRSIIMKIMMGQLPEARFEFTYTKLAGNAIEIEATCSPVTYQGSNAIQVILRDITERNLAEAAERAERDYAEALVETAALLTSTLNFDEVLARILSSLDKVIPHEASNIMLLSKNAKTARVVADKGYQAYGMQDWLRSTVFSVNDTENFRHMLEFGEPSSIADTQKDSRWVSHPNTKWIRSCTFAPIKVLDHVIGFINVDSSIPGFYTPKHAQRLMAFATHAGIAIRNAQLLQEIQQSNTELRMAYDSTLLGWSKALELRDVETIGHSQRVMDLTLLLANRMGIKGEDLTYIRYGVLLHDIGKIAIPDSILFNPSGLDEQEWDIMRKHPVFSYELLSPIAYLHPAIDIPYCHHEHWDGSGYPRQLKGTAIPLAARIFAVVDVWDGMTSDRRYRPALPRDEVVEYIQQQSGKLFDPVIVDEFIQLLHEKHMIHP